MKNKIALFDFDGVIADTEPLYDIFWNEAAIRYNVGIDNFASVIKGTIMPNIMKQYFSSYPQEAQAQLLKESADFEESMSFPLIKGSLDFVKLLKNNGVLVGLVTSSHSGKIEKAIKVLNIPSLFDTIVTADHITEGKPHPMCYQLAAKDLNVAPQDCIVFEDSFAGIQAGTDAGMRVIGISSTNAEDKLKDKVYAVIENFEGLTWDNYIHYSK
jgi:HAD superfamily hydrolase (TIGR01509 family)